MPAIRSSLRVAAPPSAVWAALADIPSHVEWMADAEEIRFTSAHTHGVGTTFDCDTRVGPLRLVDRMEITEWQEGRTMGVRHAGVVTGSGAFELADVGQGATDLTWTEELTFPWWMGGPLGARVAAPVLRRVWVGNLRRLRRRVESSR